MHLLHILFTQVCKNKHKCQNNEKANMYDDKNDCVSEKEWRCPSKKAILVFAVMNTCAFYLSATEMVWSWALNVSLCFW